MRSAGPGDDQARFLADLRALRDAAAIGYDELAARAHYPSDILKEAENGPCLPTLPILAAYVRACEGDVLEWEERWRRVANEAAGDPGLPVRAAGASPAAVAGARAGVGVVPPDVYDPERIKAALRGGHRSDHQPSRPDTRSGGGVGRTRHRFWRHGLELRGRRFDGMEHAEAAAGWDATGMDTTGAPPTGWDTTDAGPGLSTMEAPTAGWTAATEGAATNGAAAEWGATNGATESWGTRDGGSVDSAGWGDQSGLEGTSANGNHEALNDGSFDQEGQFAGSWSPDSELLPDQQGSESAWPGLPETELEPWPPGAETAPPELASGELAWPELADTELAEPSWRRARTKTRSRIPIRPATSWAGPKCPSRTLR